MINEYEGNTDRRRHGVRETDHAKIPKTKRQEGDI